MNTARQLAVKLLLEGGKSNEHLNQALSGSKVSRQDKKLCTRLYYGVLQRELTLESIVRHYSRRPPEKLDPPVRYILYVGLYQILYCDGIPEGVAVSESVNLTYAFRVKSASGVVNFVLRQFLRDGKRLPECSDPWQEAQVRYSVPKELFRQVVQERGEAFAERFFSQALEPPPCVVRFNSLKGDAASIAELSPKPCGTENAYIVSAPDILSTQSYRQGLIHVQDEASQLCCGLLGAQPGDTVLDMCAAPGGKSFTIAEQMKNQGRLLAFDANPSREKMIQEGAKRLGISIIESRARDMSEFWADIPMADRVLCDVPCSGYGVIRRKPEIRKKPLASCHALPETQYRILEMSSRYLKPEGVLVYSTCTILRAEDEDVVERFLKEHDDFTLEKRLLLPDESHSCDGFFMARLRRRRSK